MRKLRGCERLFGGRRDVMGPKVRGRLLRRRTGITHTNKMRAVVPLVHIYITQALRAGKCIDFRDDSYTSVI